MAETLNPKRFRIFENHFSNFTALMRIDVSKEGCIWSLDCPRFAQTSLFLWGNIMLVLIEQKSLGFDRQQFDILHVLGANLINAVTHFPEFSSETRWRRWWERTGKCWLWKLRSLWSDPGWQGARVKLLPCGRLNGAVYDYCWTVTLMTDLTAKRQRSVSDKYNHLKVESITAKKIKK